MTTFPVEQVNPEREGQLDSWRPGSCASVQPDNEDEGSEGQGARRAAAHAESARRPLTRRTKWYSITRNTAQ